MHIHMSRCSSLKSQDCTLSIRRALDACAGRHYLSNAPCLMRPHLLFVCFVVSRITMITANR